MDKAKLLVVDDDAITLDLLLEVLGNQFDIYVAIDGPSALALMEQGISPDLVLLDIQMPDMDGFEVFRQLRHRWKHLDLPVIFLTSRDSVEDEAKGLELGAVDYISKPYNPIVVSCRIQTQLELKQFRDHLQEQVHRRTQLLAEAVAETRRKELHLQGVINTAPIGIGLIRSSVIHNANQMMADLTGYPVGKLEGMSLRRLYADEQDFIRDEQKIALLLQGTLRQAVEARLRKADGTDADFALRFSPLEQNGEEGEAIFSAMDISDRKRHEAQLEARIRERTSELRTANQLMEQEILERKRSEQALIQSEIDLEKQRATLEEANVALKVLIREAEQERREFEERVSSNLLGLVEPYLDKLKKSPLDDRQRNFVSIIEGNLKNIVSPFVRTSVSMSLNLTPAEIQVANLIKQGRTTKEIAELLHLSQRTIEKHRNNMRRKFGINNRKVNLSTLLNGSRAGINDQQ